MSYLFEHGRTSRVSDEMPRIGHRIDALAEISCLLERRDANAFSILASVTDQVLAEYSAASSRDNAPKWAGLEAAGAPRREYVTFVTVARRHPRIRPAQRRFHVRYYLTVLDLCPKADQAPSSALVINCLCQTSNLLVINTF